MGYLIPENIPSRNDIPSSVSEVAALLRDLMPDDVTIWLEGLGDDAVLLLLDPAVGLLLIEAPRPTALGLRRRRDRRIRRQHDTLTVAELVKRGDNEVAKYQQILEAERRLGMAFRTAATVAIPTISRQEAEDIGIDEDPDHLLLRDDFQEGVQGAIARIFANNRAPRRLTENEERVVRGIVRPQIIISGQADDDTGQLVFRPPTDGTEDVVRVLDRQQERLATTLGSGYRVIRGVAGSGKSLVLVHRARHLAEHFPQQRFLITCFNVPLSKALEAQVAGFSNIKVRTVDGLAWDLGQRGNSNEPDSWVRARERAAELIRKAGPEDKYDAVFVDEAQDLDVPALELAFGHLKPERDDFVIALDGAQNIYRKRAHWNPPGTNARGRTTFLRTCYRNTKEIAEFAWRFLEACDIDEVTDDTIDDPTLIVQPEATSRRGRPVEVLQCADVDAEADSIVRRITEAHDSGIPWGSMAVLYGSHTPWVFAIMRRLDALKIPNHWVARNFKAKREVMSAGDAVRLATLQGLKGLEFSRVFICGVNKIWDRGGDDELTRRRLVYVAMTRAMDELTITISGTGPIGQALLAAQG